MFLTWGDGFNVHCQEIHSLTLLQNTQRVSNLISLDNSVLASLIVKNSLKKQQKIEENRKNHKVPKNDENKTLKTDLYGQKLSFNDILFQKTSH